MLLVLDVATDEKVSSHITPIHGFSNFGCVIYDDATLW